VLGLRQKPTTFIFLVLPSQKTLTSKHQKTAVGSLAPQLHDSQRLGSLAKRELAVLSSPSAFPEQNIYLAVNDLTVPEAVQISSAEVKRVKTTAELFLVARTPRSACILFC